MKFTDNYSYGKFFLNYLIANLKHSSITARFDPKSKNGVGKGLVGLCPRKNQKTPDRLCGVVLM